MTRVIDADGHITEPRLLWESYAAPAYRERVIQVRRDDSGRDEIWVGGERREHSNPAPASMPGGFAASRTPGWDDVLPGGFDPARRLAVLDEEGIDIALLFPTIYLLIGDVREPEVAAACCRAYNDWMADFCRRDPERLHGVGIVPLQDPALAARETQRIATLGLRAALIRPERYAGLALYDPACEPFFAAAQECDLAVAVHGSFGVRMPGFAARWQNPFFTHMVCHPFEQMAACMDIVCGGVLERFPRLRVGFFESGLGWLVYWLERMDEHFDDMRRFVPTLRRRPSDAFRAQCFLSMDPDDGEALAQIAAHDLAHCVVWGSDYPHYDCVYPGVRKALETSCAGHVESGVLDEVLLANPLRYMGLAG